MRKLNGTEWNEIPVVFGLLRAARVAHWHGTRANPTIYQILGSLSHSADWNGLRVTNGETIASLRYLHTFSTTGGFRLNLSEIESRLTEIWEQLLSVHPIGRQDNFFDLGGDSIVAVRLSATVKKVWNIDLPLAIVFQTPTVQEMAAFLDGKITPKWSPRIAPLKPSGTRSPFLCVDAGPFFRSLTQRLSTDQPFLGLRLADTSDLPTRFSLEDIAQYHLETIREIQPKGPYCLGGWSLSGLVAYEIAQRLRAAGEEVPLLVLFDVTNWAILRRPWGWKSFCRAVSVRTWRVKHFLSTLSGLKPNEKWDQVCALAAERYLNLQRMYWVLYDRLQSRVSRRIPMAPREPSQAVFVASRRYQPQPYGGRVVLFRSAVQADGPYQSTKLGWEGLIADLDICDMPGDHDDMFLDPYVDLLANQLERKLSGAPALAPREAIAGPRGTQLAAL